MTRSERLKAWSKDPTVKKFLGGARRGIRFVNEVAKQLPSSQDTKLGSTLKILGLLDVAVSVLQPAPEKEFDEFRAKHRLTEIRNDPGLPQFITHVAKSAGMVTDTIEIGSKSVFLMAHPTVGKILAVANSWNGWDSILYHTAETDFVVLKELAWTAANNRVEADLDLYGRLEGFEPFPFVANPLFGTDAERMRKLVEQHKLSSAKGKTRVYMLYGPPGCGKSSFGQALADQIGVRILRVPARAFSMSRNSQVFALFELLEPDVLMLDDVDKSMTAAAFLDILSAIKARKGATAILTANAVSDFDRGLLRPGRIDTWVEFTHPAAEVRSAILKGYLDKHAVYLSAEDFERLVHETEGLTQDYLREAIDLLTHMDLEEVIQRLTQMKALLIDKDD